MAVMVGGLTGVAGRAYAQAVEQPGPPAGGEFRLGKDGGLTPTAKAPDADAETVAKARTLLAQVNANGGGRYAQQALKILNGFIDRQRLAEVKSSHLPEALLRRGDAQVLLGEEFEALYDYEEVIKIYPGSDQFVLALEREMEIAIRYLNGLRKKGLFGFRFEDGVPVGEELLIRVQERLPGSQLAERAGIELSDYYYRTRDLKMAAESYDVFTRNYPRSEYGQKALLRRIYSNIAQFKGPEYDASALIEAQQLIKRFVRYYPADAEQAGVGDALSARLDESAGAQMLEVGRWYLRRSDPVSARLILKRLFRRHPNTVAARDADKIFEEQGWTREQSEQPAVTPKVIESPKAESKEVAK